MKLKLELLIDVPEAETQEARDRVEGLIDDVEDSFHGYRYGIGEYAYIGEVLERKLEWIGDIQPIPPHDPDYVAPDCGPQLLWWQEDIPGDANENQQWVADGHWREGGVALFQYRLRPIVHENKLCWQCHSDKELVFTDYGTIWTSLEEAKAGLFRSHLATIESDQS